MRCARSDGTAPCLLRQDRALPTPHARHAVRPRVQGTGRPGPPMYRSWRAFLRDAHHNRLLLIPAVLYAVRPGTLGACTAAAGPP